MRHEERLGVAYGSGARYQRALASWRLAHGRPEASGA